MIRNVTRQDQGTYICRGENGEGRRAVAAVSFVEVLRKYTSHIVKGTFTRNVCVAFVFSLIFAALFLKMQVLSINTITYCPRPHC